MNNGLFGGLFFCIFDNIILFTEKEQKRLTRHIKTSDWWGQQDCPDSFT